MLLYFRLLGEVFARVSTPAASAGVAVQENSSEALGTLLSFHLNTKSANQRIAVAYVVKEWADLQQVSTCANDTNLSCELYHLIM